MDTRNNKLPMTLLYSATDAMRSATMHPAVLTLLWSSLPTEITNLVQGEAEAQFVTIVASLVTYREIVVDVCEMKDVLSIGHTMDKTGQGREAPTTHHYIIRTETVHLPMEDMDNVSSGTLLSVVWTTPGSKKMLTVTMLRNTVKVSDSGLMRPTKLKQDMLSTTNLKIANYQAREPNWQIHKTLMLFSPHRPRYQKTR